MIGLTFWVGGLFVNMLVLMPSLQVISPAERGKMMEAFLKRFAPLAWGATALVGVTGLILANSLIGFSALFSFSTRYGNILLTKIILVAVMILNGAYLGFVVGPRIASFAPHREPLNRPALARGSGLLARRRNSSSSRGG